MESNAIIVNPCQLREFISSEVNSILLRLNLVPENNQDTIFDLNQACAYLNLKPATIYDLKFRNKIPTLKRGKKLCFSKKALDEWNEAGRPANEDPVISDIDKFLSKVKRK